MIALTLIHVASGSITLLAGAGALSVAKGGRRHDRIGTIFFAAMLVMAGSGALMAALKPERGTAVIGVFTAYLVVTARAAARRRDGRPGRIERLALPLAVACFAALILLGMLGANDPRGRIDSLPWQVHFVFAGLATLAIALDVNFLLRGRLSGMQRIGRHLWRMCTALLIATMSFFQGQQDEFPDAIRGWAIWYLPTLALLATMIFWIFRARLGKRYRAWPPHLSRPAPPETVPPG